MRAEVDDREAHRGRARARPALAASLALSSGNRCAILKMTAVSAAGTYQYARLSTSRRQTSMFIVLVDIESAEPVRLEGREDAEERRRAEHEADRRRPGLLHHAKLSWRMRSTSSWNLHGADGVVTARTAVRRP